MNTAERIYRSHGITGLDTRTVKALAHPLRVQIVHHLRTRETASPNELADVLDASLGVVSYHVRRLHELGFLKLVKRTPRRGAIEHHYRLETDLHGALRSVAERMGGAPEMKRSATTVLLDEPAAETFRAEMGAVLDRLQELAAESAARIRRAKGTIETDGVSVDLIFGLSDATVPSSDPRSDLLHACLG